MRSENTEGTLVISLHDVHKMKVQWGGRVCPSVYQFQLCKLELISIRFGVLYTWYMGRKFDPMISFSPYWSTTVPN